MFHEQESVLSGSLVHSLRKPGIFFQKMSLKPIRTYSWKTDLYPTNKATCPPVVVCIWKKGTCGPLPFPNHKCYLLKTRIAVSLFSHKFWFQNLQKHLFNIFSTNLPNSFLAMIRVRKLFHRWKTRLKCQNTSRSL